jgi:hypothetical protein
MLRLFLDYTDKCNLRKQSKTKSAILVKTTFLIAILDPATAPRFAQDDKKVPAAVFRAFHYKW